MSKKSVGKLYELTPEHRAQLKPWADRWIANAMSTVAMDERDRAAMVVAMRGVYGAAGLPWHGRVVFAPSPLVAAFAGCFASAIWHVREIGNVPATATWAATRDATWAATRDATEDATWDATEAATRDATWAATWDATRDATRDATWAATRAATRDATEAVTRAATRDATEAATRDATEAATWAATWDATWDATEAATRDATWAATRAATRDATEDATWDATEAATRDATEAATEDADAHKGLVSLMLGCLRHWDRMWAGGNQWSAWASYLSFFDRVADLRLDIYEKWRHYEAACIHGGPRMEHKQFVIVSDRPEILRIDDRNRPHCEDGPSHRWRDGWSLYHWHGVRVPAKVILSPEKLTVDEIKAETNAEVRRVMRERFGDGRYLVETKAKLIDSDFEGARKGAAPRVLLEDDEKQRFLVGTDGSTGRVYYMRTPRDVKTCREAHNALCGFDESVILNKS